MASFTTGPNGQMIASAGPTMYLPAAQNIEGGPLDAAANKTIASQAAQVEAAKALGAGQKGSSRRKRRGGAVPNLNASIPLIPTANSIPGVSVANTHLNAVNNLNQIRTDASYDSLINAQPRQVAGRRRKTVRKHKGRTNGRRSNRTHRRGNRKSSSRRRGSRRIL
jgi:hypothetical protein